MDVKSDTFLPLEVHEQKYDNEKIEVVKAELEMVGLKQAFLSYIYQI